MNVQPPDKPLFKGAGWVLNNPSSERKPKASPPPRLLGEQLSPVGVGRLRLQRQRSMRGRRGGGWDPPGSTCLEKTQTHSMGLPDTGFKRSGGTG